MKEEKLSDDPLIQKDDLVKISILEEGRRRETEPRIDTFFGIPYKTGGYLGTYKLFKGSLEMRTLPRLVLIGPDWPMAIVLTLTIGLYNLAALVLACISFGIYGLLMLIPFSIAFYTYLLIYTSDPGIIPKNLTETQIREKFSQATSFYQCHTCNIIVPRDAYHCPTCQVCVADMDHHCPWVGKCVGKKNMMFFWSFLIGSMFDLMLTTITICASLVCIVTNF